MMAYSRSERAGPAGSLAYICIALLRVSLPTSCFPQHQVSHSNIIHRIFITLRFPHSLMRLWSIYNIPCYLFHRPIIPSHFPPLPPVSSACLPASHRSFRESRHTNPPCLRTTSFYNQVQIKITLNYSKGDDGWMDRIHLEFWLTH
ncbi:hypothetical protein M432DRAFT_618076 [Thermoascus aurantiacus ATCC 26904]